jgi:uncharacterized protein (DUF1778 family)
MSQIDKVEHYDHEAHIAPETLIEENNIIHLSAEDQKRLAEELLNPPAPTPAMLRAEESYARLFRKAR